MLDPVSEDYYLISTDFDTASEAPYPKSIDFHPISEDYYLELSKVSTTRCVSNCSGCLRRHPAVPTALCAD